MQSYLGEIDKYSLSLINIERPLSDTEILGRVKKQLTNKHEQIDQVFRDMRIEAHKTSVETTFTSAKQQLRTPQNSVIGASAKKRVCPPLTQRQISLMRTRLRSPQMLLQRLLLTASTETKGVCSSTV